MPSSGLIFADFPDAGSRPPVAHSAIKSSARDGQRLRQAAKSVPAYEGSAMTAEELRERIAVLEVEAKHTSEKLDEANDRLDGIDAKLSEIHELFSKAKGIWWFLLILAGLAGTFGAAIIKAANWLVEKQ